MPNPHAAKVVNTFHDGLLVTAMLRDAVAEFHAARKEPANDTKPLHVLARECANGAFQLHAAAIPAQRQETVARKFMAACRTRFDAEIRNVIVTPEEVEVGH